MLRRFAFRVVSRFELLCLLLSRYLLLLGLPTMGGPRLASCPCRRLVSFSLASCYYRCCGLESYRPLVALLTCCLLFGWFLAAATIALDAATTAATHVVATARSPAFATRRAAFFAAFFTAFFSAFARISRCSATSPFNLWRFSGTRFFSFARPLSQLLLPSGQPHLEDCLG